MKHQMKHLPLDGQAIRVLWKLRLTVKMPTTNEAHGGPQPVTDLLLLKQPGTPEVEGEEADNCKPLPKPCKRRRETKTQMENPVSPGTGSQ